MKKEMTMMTKKQGLSIELEQNGDELFLALKAIGTLTHEDYKRLTPMIDSALEGVTAPKIKALFDGTEMQGWELLAAWDDLKLGIKHGSEFEKIAMIGNREWQKLAAKIGGWFIGGEVEYFEDKKSALLWLGKSEE